MKHLKNFLSLILLALLFACNSDSDVAPNSLSKQIDDHLEQNQNPSEPGLSILIKHEGEIIYERSVGLARKVDSHLIDTDTQFRIGSITKPITAIAIMKLVEEDKLELSDKLLKFLPELPSSFSEINVNHLLTHRSGLRDYIDDNNDLNTLDNLPTSAVLDFVDGSGLENLKFEPGMAGDYSNTGYVFLALIIEKVTGISYPDYLRMKIFEPVKMSNTFVISESQHLGDNGNNYALSFATNLNVLGFNSLIYGAGGVASTANDLMRLSDALLNYEIVTKETHDQMTQTYSSIPEYGDYGLGWFTGTGSYWHAGKFSDVNDFWHMGGFDGYRTVLSINPDLHLQVAILSNNGQTTQDLFLEILRMTRIYIKQSM
ncbi:MAG: serine hydrolase domain-containing protein [Cyclobacteriaceae bacterium]